MFTNYKTIAYEKALSFFIVLPLLICFACHKLDYTTVERIQFEKEIVNLDFKQQEVEIKANRANWQMAVSGKDDNSMEGDTINGEWYTLMKKNQGESLLINVASNESIKRSVVIGIKSGDTYTRITVNQAGK